MGIDRAVDGQETQPDERDHDPHVRRVASRPRDVQRWLGMQGHTVSSGEWTDRLNDGPSGAATRTIIRRPAYASAMPSTNSRRAIALLAALAISAGAVACGSSDDDNGGSGSDTSAQEPLSKDA